jgi:hypothetical protein
MTNPHIQKRTATTLAGAKSIQRSLALGGYQIDGIYELLNVHLHIKPNGATHCGQFHWEWDEEVRVTS